MPDGPVRLGILDDPTQWVLHRPTTRPAAPAFVHRLLTRAPAQLASDGRLTPDLATWHWENDALIVTLEDHARWSDGTPITADDVAAGIEVAREEGTFAFHAERVAVNGPQELRVTFDSDRPECAAATELLRWPLVQSTEWPPVLTSGSYTVEATDPNRWHFQSRTDALPSVQMVRLADGPALKQAWTDGDVDLIVGDDWLLGQPPPVPPADAQTIDVPGPLLAALAFRLDHPILSDSAVRTALALATAPAELYASGYGGRTSLLTALLPPGHWAAPDDGPTTGDTAGARALLDDAGWRDRNGDGVRENGTGEQLQLTVIVPLSAHDARWERLGPALRDQWADVGVDLRVLYQEPVALEERIHRPAWDVALLAFAVGVDPDQSTMWSASENLLTEDLNVMGYREPTVADLMQRAGQTPGCDPSDRAPLYHQAWDTINADLPLLVLFPLPTRVFAGPSLRDVTLDYWPPSDPCATLPCG